MLKQKELVKHVSLEELKILIRKEKNWYIHERLLFIHQLYLGDSVAQACERLCIAEQTGYNWLDSWNKDGYHKLAPEFGGGAPPKLTDEQKDKVKGKLKEKGNWLTSEVRAMIRQSFNVTYSDRHIKRMLNGFGMHYAKPYQHDYRKPENAEQKLAQSIEAALSDIAGNAVVGFFDEARPQTTDNRQRFWSFNKPTIRKNTERLKANTFGFYPVNGKEVVEFMGRSKIQNVCEFFLDIKNRNPGRHIVIFLDNFQSHVSNATKQFAKSHGITLIFLPSYSPQLNPIESIWKGMRRRVSQVFAKSEWSFQETIRTAFHRLAKKGSFAGGWLEKFGHLFPNLLCQ